MSEFTLTKIDRLRYRPTKAAEDFLGDIRASIMPGDKASVARLAIARSLAESATRKDLELPKDTPMGNAIEGIHLFGEDHDVWACLICTTLDSSIDSPQDFKSLVEAHWHRGAMLLKDDYRDTNQSDVDFVIRLANIGPKGFNPSWSDSNHDHPVEAFGPVQVGFGDTSLDYLTKEPISITLNAPGTSPHIAIMGKTRSGKSRSGLDITSSVARQTSLPLLLIDPKGEFVKDGQLVSKPEWNGETLDRFFPGIRPIDVPISTIPLDFLWRSPTASQHDLSQLAIAFKDSFQKCIKARGDVALDLLRSTVRELLITQRTPISLQNVLSSYTTAAENAGKTAGSIGAKLSEINSIRLFTATHSPKDFFSNRWVISLGNCSDEPKRLAIFLLLDALNAYLMSLSDSGLDDSGHRALRHMLIIDEAREILSYKHGALSSLIRKSASKGGVTVLLSQGADDFDQEDDDFLEQMGVIGVFALSSQTVKSLTGAFGKRMKVEDFSDQNLPTGVALVKYPGHTPQKIIAWK